ncbi:MAG: helix-turn-helix transcriptional regulator [Alphaproteobacteria bacterium]|nr:helix-turn-helix transcriptional regulator [Alphaproteobacteria bacterium]
MSPRQDQISQWPPSRHVLFRIWSLGDLQRKSATAVQRNIGIIKRHLCRQFRKHVEATPLQTARTIRVQRAKGLLDESDLKIVEIAFQVGFGSVRQFNATFSEKYCYSLSQYRKRRRNAPNTSNIQPHPY